MVVFNQLKLLSSEHVNRTLVISGLVGTVFTLAFLITAVGYLLLFQRQRIKRWLRSPYRIPPVRPNTVAHTHHADTRGRCIY